MNTNKEFGHFGTIELITVATADFDNHGARDVPAILLHKAPLKYHDKDEPEESKVKCTAVYIWVGHRDTSGETGKWEHCSNHLALRDNNDPEETEKWYMAIAKSVKAHFGVS